MRRTIPHVPADRQQPQRSRHPRRLSAWQRFRTWAMLPGRPPKYLRRTRAR